MPWRERSRSSIRSAARVDVLLAIGSIVVLVVLSVQAAMGVGRIGISNDEPGHVGRTNQWLATGWYLPPSFVDEAGEVRDTIRRERLHTYGAAFSLSAHTAAALVGVEDWDEAATTRTAYLVRRLAVVALGVATAVAVGYASLIVTQRRSFALWSAAAVLAMPLWTGYSMFAVKDTPVGAGWTMVTAGAVAVIQPGAGRRRLGIAGALVALGVWFSVGTRIALWLPVTGTLLIAFAMLFLGEDRSGLRARAATIGVASIAGALAIVLVHRRNAATPIEWLWTAVTRSGDFEGGRSTLTAGRLLADKPPWWYLPAWLGGSVPVLIGVLSVLGVAIAAVDVMSRRHGGFRECIAAGDGVMGLWVLQALFLPAAATVGNSTMYAGLRHHLYALPALAALSGYALHRLSLAGSAPRTIELHRRTIACFAGVIALAIPMIDQLALFPYAFVYKNEFAGSVDDRWETDMHWVSAREALWHLPTGTPVLCYRSATVGGFDPPIGDCAQRPQLRPFLGETGRRASTADIGTDVWVIARRYHGSPPARGCIPVADVTRRLRGEEIVLSYVLRCDPSMVQIVD